jgi:hypothetical protein
MIHIKYVEFSVLILIFYPSWLYSDHVTHYCYWNLICTKCMSDIVLRCHVNRSISIFITRSTKSVYSMYCIVSYCVLCLYLICYLYTNVSTKVTRNKHIYRKSIDVSYREYCLLFSLIDCFASTVLSILLNVCLYRHFV